MKFLPIYDPPEEAIQALMREQRVGRIVTVDTEGNAYVGVHVFAFDADVVELHLVRGDEQIAHVESTGRAIFEIDDVLSAIPSYWVGAEATHADQLYRCVTFQCAASVVRDADALVAHLRALLQRYQPEAGYEALSYDSPLYAKSMRALVLLRLSIVSRRAKFKLGQKLDRETHARVRESLAARGSDTDQRSLAAIEELVRMPRSSDTR
jgi:uncharacterized protein